MVPERTKTWWMGLSTGRRRILKGGVGVALGAVAGFAY